MNPARDVNWHVAVVIALWVVASVNGQTSLKLNMTNLFKTVRVDPTVYDPVARIWSFNPLGFDAYSLELFAFPPTTLVRAMIIGDPLWCNNTFSSNAARWTLSGLKIERGVPPTLFICFGTFLDGGGLALSDVTATDGGPIDLTIEEVRQEVRNHSQLRQKSFLTNVSAGSSVTVIDTTLGVFIVNGPVSLAHLFNVNASYVLFQGVMKSARLSMYSCTVRAYDDPASMPDDATNAIGMIFAAKLPNRPVSNCLTSPPEVSSWMPSARSSAFPLPAAPLTATLRVP
jgi:hypothetical protein